MSDLISSHQFVFPHDNEAEVMRSTVSPMRILFFLLITFHLGKSIETDVVLVCEHAFLNLCPLLFHCPGSAVRLCCPPTIQNGGSAPGRAVQEPGAGFRI